MSTLEELEAAMAALEPITFTVVFPRPASARSWVIGPPGMGGATTNNDPTLASDSAAEVPTVHAAKGYVDSKTTFTGFSAATAVSDADTLAVNQGAGNLKQTFAAIKTWIKSWIAKGDVGLGNVPNVDTSTQANVNFIGLSAAAAVSDGDTLPVNQGAGNLKQTFGTIKTWVNGLIATYVAAQDLEVFKGPYDCSGNPNYPAADAGHVYRVSVAGKIGGAAGVNVEAGDRLECFVDGSASGNHATVGANWMISQVNIDGAVVGPTSATNNAIALFDLTTGKLLKDSGVTIDADGAFASNSDARVATQKATKTALDSKLATAALDGTLAGKSAASAGADTILAIKSGAVVLANRVATTAKDRGAVGDGVATENIALGNLFSSHSEIYIDAGTYKVSPEIDLTEKDVHVVIHPSAKFTTAAWDMGALVKAIGASPSLAFEAFFKTVNTDYDLYEHVVGKSIFMVSDTVGAKTVSLYSNVEVKQGSGFGANFGAYVTGAGTGIAAEIDSHVTHASGLGYALVLGAVGSYASQAAVVIQSNSVNSPYLTGISFNNSTNNAVSGSSIKYNAGTSDKFIEIDAAAVFTTAIIDTPVFIIGPTVSSSTGQLRVDASASASPKISAVGSATNIAITFHSKGTGGLTLEAGDSLARLVVKGTVGATYPEITAGSGGFTLAANGSDTNASAILQGKGTGGVNLLDGALASKFRINTTGIGFFATTPVARSTGWGLPTGTTTKTTFDTGSVTTTQLAERFKGLIEALHSTAGYGLIAT